MRLIDSRVINSAELVSSIKNRERYINDVEYRLCADDIIVNCIANAPTIEPSGDPISRAEAIEVLCRVCGWNENGECTIQDVCKSFVEIKSLPSADRPKGEWLDVEHEPYCECSVCGAYIESLDDDFAFCPRCGADMRPEK